MLRFILCALAWIAAALCAAWAFGALYLDFPKAGAFAAVLFVIALLAIVILVRGKLLKLGIVFGGCALVAAWWLTLSPATIAPGNRMLPRPPGQKSMVTK